MKISKSKQELASIISENGGWCNRAEWAAQDRIVAFFSGAKPEYDKTERIWCSNGDNGNYISSIESVNRVANWHQTILSRAEYFHLYPVPDAEVSIAVENNTSLNVTVSDKPTIEQLAADYRNLLDFAQRKQQEADDAKADADAKLKSLELAGEALGLLVSPITENQEPELVITDWRDLQVGDIIECVGRWESEDTDGRQFTVTGLESENYNGSTPIRIVVPGVSIPVTWGGNFKFIRRP